jgi:hypothetical protein
MRNGYPHYAALDGAIDGNPNAQLWLQKNNYEFLALFANACNQNYEALQWLRENDLQIFVLLSAKIHGFRDRQVFDHHKIHF